MKLDDFKIYQNGKLKEALRLIDQNESGIIFVTDAQDRVIGVATDGAHAARGLNFNFCAVFQRVATPECEGSTNPNLIISSVWT